VPSDLLGKKVTIKVEFNLTPLETVSKPLEFELKR
jgi:hypothetical protein